MGKIDVGKIWSLNYRLSMAVIRDVAAQIGELGIEVKELFLLSEVEAHPYPAELAEVLAMPKPTVTAYVKRLEAACLLERQIDAQDLRRHRLIVTAEGRKVVTKGLTLLAHAFNKRLSCLSASEQAELSSLLERLS